MLKQLKKMMKPAPIAETSPETDALLQGKSENTVYWSQHNVTLHLLFGSRHHSLEYLDWRNSQYLFYDELMPTSGFDDKVILDYGCGPGHDLVGFVEHSAPARVIAMDISPVALKEAETRLLLHGEPPVEFIPIEDGTTQLPIENNSVDYIHSSGVLHHTPNMMEILAEFHRILKPEGLMRLMMYNYDSLWLHLYVAYQRRLIKEIDAGLSLEDAFRRSTDGEACPISRCYRPAEFVSILQESGFDARLSGCAISAFEMTMLPDRYKAIMAPLLPKPHRDFLKALTFDAYGRPLYQGSVAGIDAVYEARK